MVEVAATVVSIAKDKIVLGTPEGQTLHCEFASGKVPKVGNKGVAVVDEAKMQIRFKGPKGSAHLRLIEVE